MTEPFDIIIFGGSGDLALRKLIPALYRAYREDKLPDGSRIVASCRNPADVNDYHETIRRAPERRSSSICLSIAGTACEPGS